MRKIPEILPCKTVDRIMSSFCDPTGEITLQIELNYSHGIDIPRLSRSIDLLVDAEPVLGCRLVIQKKGNPYWKRLSDPYRDTLTTIR